MNMNELDRDGTQENNDWQFCGIYKLLFWEIHLADCISPTFQLWKVVFYLRKLRVEGK